MKKTFPGKFADLNQGEKKYVNFVESKENENSTNKQFFRRGSPDKTDPNMILDEESEPSMSQDYERLKSTRQ